MDIINEIKKFNLDPNEFIVVGGGILCVLGIRDTNDIDLVVEKKIYNALLGQSGWTEKKWPKGDPTISKDICEIGTDWGDDKKVYTYNELRHNSVCIQGINFISLEFLKEWKFNKGREKDKRDVELINKYLKDVRLL